MFRKGTGRRIFHWSETSTHFRAALSFQQPFSEFCAIYPFPVAVEASFLLQPSQAAEPKMTL
jgi:hypothetical protein